MNKKIIWHEIATPYGYRYFLTDGKRILTKSYKWQLKKFATSLIVSKKYKAVIK